MFEFDLITESGIDFCLILLLVYFGNNCDSTDTWFERFDRGAENSSNRWEQICGLEGELQKKSGREWGLRVLWMEMKLGLSERCGTLVEGTWK